MRRINKNKLKQLKELTTLMVLCLMASTDFNAQIPNPIAGYSVLQQVVTKTGGGARTVQEGDNGSYYIEYSGSYNDTLLINSRENPLIFDGEFDTIPHRYKKIIKYNELHEPIAVQDIYSYQDLSINNASFIIEKMLFDNGDLFVEMEVRIQEDVPRTFFIGEKAVAYGPNTGDIYMSGRIIVVLDGNTLEYKSHVLVQNDGRIGLDSWSVKDGYLYFRRTPINLMVVAQDTFMIDHGEYLDYWVNLVKYDYTNEEVMWSQVVANKIPILAPEVNPQFTGLDIDDNGRIFVSMNDLGNSFTIGNDTIPYTTATPGHGAVIVLNTGGEILRSDIINGSAFVLDVKSIGSNSYILISATSDFINYRGFEIGTLDNMLSEEVIVIKVNVNGDYVSSYKTLPGCTGGFNHMRVSKNEELLLFGQYYNLGPPCNGFTTEGQELPYEHNGSILTMDADLNVLSNALFSAESVDAIPAFGNISSSGKLVRYNGRPWDVQWPYFDEEPFFFENAEESFRSIVLVEDRVLDNVIDNEVEIKVRMYPNPTRAIFQIYVEEGNTSKYTVEVYNMNGTLIKSIKDYKGDVIDLEDQSSGTYIVKLISDTHIATEKLIKI